MLDVKQSKEFWAWDVLQGHENSQLELFCTKNQNTGQKLANFQHTDCFHEHQKSLAVRRWPGVWLLAETSQSRVQRYTEIVQGSHRVSLTLEVSLGKNQ